MTRFAKILLVVVVLFSIANLAFADRGVGKKNKTKTVLNINNPASLKSSISLNLKSGLTYKGSLLGSKQTVGNSVMNSTLITYQKGNTIYIIPYKSRVTMPEMKLGYTGVKLIIKSRK